MPARVNTGGRVVGTISVSVKRLWVGRSGHYRIRADKPSNQGVIVPRPVVVKPGAVQLLAGELLIYRDGAGAGGAEGVVVYAADRVTIATVGDG